MDMKRVYALVLGAAVFLIHYPSLMAAESVGNSVGTKTVKAPLKKKSRRDQQLSSVSTQYHKTTVTSYSLLDIIKGWFGIKSEPKKVVIQSEVSLHTSADENSDLNQKSGSSGAIKQEK